MSVPSPNPFAGAFPNVPYPSVDDLMTIGRELLLDPAVGPRVPSLVEGGALTLLKDVRIRGRTNEQGGTLNWTPGETGFPFAILDVATAAKTYKETRRVWEDWKTELSIGLTADINAWQDYAGWARAWEATLQQWFALHRGFSIVTDPTGDHWWEYRTFDGARVYVAGSNIAVYGPILLLNIHNVVPVTWSV